ncbi:MAG: FAD-dependent oxidoreductase [Betaproteobacteria bacterium]|nr:FAD-dependent oxidoreductase [Betaproteobacteria bacterium]
MSKIAIIGGGISGLACAWLLARRHDVVLFEAGSYAGGHTNTVDATVDGISHPVDTGFLVFNDRTYPNLVKLFAELGVESADSDMSLSVRIGQGELEWSGSSLVTVFAQPSNLVRPRFLRMLADLLRFNREAAALAASAAPVTGTLGEFLDARGYGPEVRELYLIPMAACIWSTPATQINRFPLATFLHFCSNHGLLAVSNRPQWRTVKGGAREYVKKLVAALPDVRLATPVHRVRRFPDRVEVATGHGTEPFDQVVLATHTDQSLALLEHPSVEERAVLEAIPYQANRAVLHTDERLLPRRRRAWASWNFHAPKPGISDEPVCLTYLINRLQPLPFTSPVMVTLNPVEAPREERVLASFDYHHPVFLETSDEAKRRVVSLQGRERTWFCGAWTRYGFHEDGLVSALNVAGQMGVPIPWTA